MLAERSEAVTDCTIKYNCNRLVDSINSMHADPLLLGRDVMSLGNQFSAFRMNVRAQLLSDTTLYSKQETTPNPQ